MTALTVPARAPSGTRTISPTRQALQLGRRAVLGTLRQPQMWAPSMIFPLILCAVNTAALNKAIKGPGGVGPSYLNFALATVVVQGILFAGSNGGNDLANDIETGFLDRLVASPVSRPAILVGRLGGSTLFGLAQGIFFLFVLGLFGARVKAGIPGYLVIILAGMLLALALGGLSSALALRTGSAEAVQGISPLFFVFIFLSSAFFPRSRMSGWFKAIVTANPITWLIESLRNLVLVGWSTRDALRALAIPAALAVALIALAVSQLRWRLSEGKK
jgi:ABC-2 type transport system permease protein